jgi:predicted transcriptional regulator
MNEVTTKEAAKIIGVTPPVVMRYVKEDKLHPLEEPRPGKMTKFDEEEVELIAKAHKPKRKRKPRTQRAVVTKEEVKHPDHYQNSLGVEVIDIINEYFRDNYNLGNVLKYLLRADKKGKRQQDLEKALQYLTWEVEHGRRSTH